MSRRTSLLMALFGLLGVAGAVSFVVAMAHVFGWGEPSVAELRARLDTIAANPVLATPAPRATLVGHDTVLCSDSSSPYSQWRFRTDEPFESVVAFYTERLGRNGWKRGSTALVGNVEFTRRFSHWSSRRFGDWTAQGGVAQTEEGYDIVVAVDDGYESGCR